MKLRTLFIMLAVTGILSALGYLWYTASGLRNIPDITLLTVDGEALPLASLRGRPLLVTFWATTCTSCVREIPHLAELYEELSPRGLEIIGIAMHHDRPDQVLAMRQARGIPYPVALDLQATAARAFGNVRVTPTSFLIAPDGRIQYHRIGTLDMARLRREILAMFPRQHAARPPLAADLT
jgi:peroxiredoxin